jgi:hypothetical protein
MPLSRKVTCRRSPSRIRVRFTSTLIKTLTGALIVPGRAGLDHRRTQPVISYLIPGRRRHNCL